MIDLKKILFPTDFSEYADYARPYAVELAKKFGSKITVVHVVAAPTYAVSYEIAVDVVTVREELEKAAEKRLNDVAAKIAADGIEVDTILEVGSGFVEIIAAARTSEADLIVIATHGWGAVKHLLLGSTAERVVRKAPCPVLTVRHSTHQFVHP